MQMDPDKVAAIGELGALISEEDGRLTVRSIPPKERRPKETSDLDIAVGDEVGMANGKRVKTAKEFKEAYDATPIAGEFKIGLRRSGQSFIVSFSKKDPKDMPTRMIVRSGGDENSDLFPALGFGLQKKGEQIVISETLPNASKEFRKNDIVQTLNGKEVKAIKDFAKELDATKVGAELKFELTRDGKTITVTVPRPEPRQMIFRNN